MALGFTVAGCHQQGPGAETAMAHPHDPWTGNQVQYAVYFSMEETAIW